MPGRDGTGPYGKGAMTGRGLGNCSKGNAKTYYGCGLRRGVGMRRRGRRNNVDID